MLPLFLTVILMLSSVVADHDCKNSQYATITDYVDYTYRALGYNTLRVITLNPGARCIYTWDGFEGKDMRLYFPEQRNTNLTD